MAASSNLGAWKARRNICWWISDRIEVFMSLRTPSSKPFGWFIGVFLNWGSLEMAFLISHRIHGAGIYANIWGILMVKYGIHGAPYIPYMDPMGMTPLVRLGHLPGFEGTAMCRDLGETCGCGVARRRLVLGWTAKGGPWCVSDGSVSKPCFFFQWIGGYYLVNLVNLVTMIISSSSQFCVTDLLERRFLGRLRPERLNHWLKQLKMEDVVTFSDNFREEICRGFGHDSSCQLLVLCCGVP